MSVSVRLQNQSIGCGDDKQSAYHAWHCLVGVGVGVGVILHRVCVQRRQEKEKEGGGCGDKDRGGMYKSTLDALLSVGISRIYPVSVLLYPGRWVWLWHCLMAAGVSCLHGWFVQRERLAGVTLRRSVPLPNELHQAQALSQDQITVLERIEDSLLFY